VECRDCRDLGIKEFDGRTKIPGKVNVQSPNVRRLCARRAIIVLGNEFLLHNMNDVFSDGHTVSKMHLGLFLAMSMCFEMDLVNC
jgi:hypothetical protein